MLENMKIKLLGNMKSKQRSKLGKNDKIHQAVSVTFT